MINKFLSNYILSTNLTARLIIDNKVENSKVNVNGKVLMYADKMTESMRRTISETERRRAMQIAYNLEHGLVPTALNKSKEKIMESTKVADGDTASRQLKYTQETQAQLAA